MFYSDNGRIDRRDHKWVHNTLTVKVAMICKVGLDTNLEKTKYIICMTGFICGKWSEEDYKRRSMGGG